MTTSNLGPKFANISEYRNVSEDGFNEIILTGQPALIRGCDFGPCIQRWDLNYLEQNIGANVITIHECREPNLNFIDKNFKYRSCKFSEFCQELKRSNSFVYLRSVHNNPRNRIPAHIGDDFPAIKNDLRPPKFIPFDKRTNELYHSSVLRIASAGVQVWTHFDLCDNVLVQVVGTKRIILISPEDTCNLYVDGDKSRVNCFDDWETCLKRFPLVANTKLYSCHLEPGDCLFIPSLWWHNIKTIDSGKSNSPNYSIGFNIFWKDPMIEKESLYAEGDVYGNKNLIPYESALSNLDKLVQHLNKLPGKYNSFYKQMIIARLKQKLSLEDP